MENPCESNSSQTKPNRDNIQCSSIMQLRLASSYYMTLQPNLFLLNLQGFENKKSWLLTVSINYDEFLFSALLCQ